MKHPCFSVATLALCLSLPTIAQTQIPAPDGWKTQTKEGGATTFTPPDLRAGEIYSVTTYDAAPLGGKSLDAYLRAFAGPVGAKAGQLGAPLSMGRNEAHVASATGTYRGPKGAQLTAAFNAFSFDGGQSVSVTRVLTSSDAVFFRYQSAYKTLVGAMTERATTGASQGPRPRVDDEPQEVADLMRVGGAIVPGMYEAFQQTSVDGFFGGKKVEFKRFHVYLYADGDYRITDDHDEDFKGRENVSTGRIEYNPKRGLLDLGPGFYLRNDNTKPGLVYCYYGRDNEGKPFINARYNDYFAGRCDHGGVLEGAAHGPQVQGARRGARQGQTSQTRRHPNRRRAGPRRARRAGRGHF